MRCSLFVALVAAAFGPTIADTARAAMGGPTIMTRVDSDGDHKLSLAEVRAAASRRYDLIQSKNGHVTMLQLGGRLKPSDLKAVDAKAGVATAVSKEEYLALADKFFDEADAHRKPGDPPGAGKLDIDELTTPAGEKLIGLLE